MYYPLVFRDASKQQNQTCVLRRPGKGVGGCSRKSLTAGAATLMQCRNVRFRPLTRITSDARVVTTSRKLHSSDAALSAGACPEQRRNRLQVRPRRAINRTEPPTSNTLRPYQRRVYCRQPRRTDAAAAAAAAILIRIPIRNRVATRRVGHPSRAERGRLRRTFTVGNKTSPEPTCAPPHRAAPRMVRKPGKRDGLDDLRG